MGPSIYDTAQVLRLAPPPEGTAAALAWLLSQQQPDGGWGNPAVPRARDVPTLAVLLAAQSLDGGSLRGVIDRGVAFLSRQAEHWAAPLPDDLPVGVELLLPYLLAEARAAGLAVPHEQYEALIALGERRRRLVASMPLRPGTTPVHSWEALGLPADAALQDDTGSIGHSPSATAAWLRASAGRADLDAEREGARRYLAGAAAATRAGIPGVVPTAWPITRFEQVFSLYVLLIADLFDHPALRDAVHQQAREVARAMRPDGVGFSDWFVPDGDDTLEALAVLRAAGLPASLETLRRYESDGHYCAYPGELQPSVSVTAHGVHAGECFGIQDARACAYLIERQQPDGRWLGDKWNGSWLYPTWRVLVALRHTPHFEAAQRGLDAIVTSQHRDGGWGLRGPSTVEETAYALLALHTYTDHPMAGAALHMAARRASEYLVQNVQPYATSAHHFWLAKENYRPERLARTIELSAALVAADILVGTVRSRARRPASCGIA